MKKLKSISQALGRIVNLPPESALSLITGFGSVVSANTITAEHFSQGRLSKGQMFCTAILNTIPLQIRRALSYHLPFTLPLLRILLLLSVSTVIVCFLMGTGSVSDYEAIVALLAGGFIMALFFRLKGTLPNQIAIFGLKPGSLICLINTLLSLLARTTVFILVIVFYPCC